MHLLFHVIDWILYCIWKTEWQYIQKGCECIGFPGLWSCGSYGLLGAAALPSIMSITLQYHTAPGNLYTVRIKNMFENIFLYSVLLIEPVKWQSFSSVKVRTLKTGWNKRPKLEVSCTGSQRIGQDGISCLFPLKAAWIIFLLRKRKHEIFLCFRDIREIIRLKN